MKLTISLATVLCITLAGILLLGVPAVSAQEEEALKLGDAEQDWVYTAVEPCRIVNTRGPGGNPNPNPFDAGETRGYNVYGDVSNQNFNSIGGGPATCPDPFAKGEPRAVHLNITVLPCEANKGWLTAYPKGSNQPQAAWLVFDEYTKQISNAGTLKTLFDPSKRDIRIYLSQKANVIIDVMGYYYDVQDLFVDEAWKTGQGDAPYWSNLKFLAPKAQVTVGENQKIFVVSHQTFHCGEECSNSVPVGTPNPCMENCDELNLWICYNKLGGPPPLTRVGHGVYDIELYPDTRVVQGLSAMIYDLPAGTYRVGLCGEAKYNSGPAWNEPSGGYTTAFVVPSTMADPNPLPASWDHEGWED